MTFLLVATLFLRMDTMNAECRRVVTGPYSDPEACIERVKPTHEYLRLMAGELNTQPLFISVVCVKGRDT